jgi:diguanylate cyclase (GGDEF)-like protein/PAS domain S-box-containing protein
VDWSFETGQRATLLDEAIGQAADAIVITDRYGIIEYVNPAFTTLTGYSSQEAVGQNSRVLKSGRHTTEFYAELWDTIRSGSVWQGEVVNRRKDGTTYVEEMRIAPIRSPEKEITGYLAIKRDVTGQRAAEESRRLLAAIVESSGDGIFAFDRAGHILTWNRGAEAIIGYSAAEAIGQHLHMLVFPERRADIDELTQQVLQGNTVPLWSEAAPHKDGRRIPVSVTAWPIRDSIGEITAVSVVFRDESMRRTVEETKALLASIVESSDDAISSVNLDGTILTWNRQCVLLHGYAPHEAIGNNIAALAPSFFKERTEGILETIRRGGAVSPFESVIQKKHGTEVDVSVRISTLRNASGESVGSSANFRDITERKQREGKLKAAEKKYRDIFNGAIEGVFRHDLEGKPLAVNPSLARILGYKSPEELLSLVKDVRRDVWADPDLRARLAEQVDQDGVVRGVECQLKRKDGSLVWVSLSGHRVPAEDGQTSHLEGFMEDITEHKRAEEALRSSEARYRSVFQTSLDGIAINRLSDGMYIDVNKAFLDLTGYQREEILGKTSLELGIWADLNDRKQWVELLQRRRLIRDVSVRLRKKSGEVFWTLNSSSLIEVEGDRWVLTAVRDVSAAKAAEDEIRSLAFYDTLTGLPNRRLVTERLRQTLAASSRNRRMGALLFIDLDNFKTMNDTLGHKTGDLLLQEVGRRLSACLRENDTVARLGGDEFVVIAEDLSESAEDAAPQARSIATKILNAILEPYLLGDRECLSSSSIGITLFGNPDDTVDDILQQADIAMYQAKSAGRNTVRFFSPALQAAVNARAALEDDLRLAIKTGQFALYYQPQVTRGMVDGVEALIRWNHPLRGLVPPNDFIPQAEESGLILSIGNWVLESACKQIAVWSKRKETASMSVAVNISAREFRSPEFVDRVLKVLDTSSADPHNLRLEITEGMLVENFEDVIAKMTTLRTYGVRFSLDDFGTGYSSLLYLKRLPLDRLKIDRAFVRDMLTDSTSGAIARTVISLSKAMELSVIAEGVESEEQREFLVSLGCHSFQGFLISHPLPIEEFESWFRCVANQPQAAL